MAAITLTSTADVCMDDNEPDTNQGDSGLGVAGGPTSNTLHSILKFDMSQVPGTVTGAVLKLTSHSLELIRPVYVTLYRLRRNDWVEAEATWNSYKTGSTWGTAGGTNTTTDIYSSTLVTAFAVHVGTPPTVVSSELTATEVEEMRNDNRGMLAVSGTDAVQGWIFGSHRNDGQEPQLVVDYWGPGIDVPYPDYSLPVDKVDYSLDVANPDYAVPVEKEDYSLDVDAPDYTVPVPEPDWAQ